MRNLRLTPQLSALGFRPGVDQFGGNGYYFGRCDPALRPEGGVIGVKASQMRIHLRCDLLRIASPTCQDPEMATPGHIGADDELPDAASCRVVELGHNLFHLFLGDLFLKLVEKPVPAGEVDEVG